MSRKSAGRDEFGERRLVGGRYQPLGTTAGVGQSRNQFRRSGDIAEAQAGKRHFGEAADGQHTRVAIEARQRLQGPSAKADLTIEIVVDNDRSAAPGPVEQGEPPIEAERHP